jgi:hypothetical protein
MLLEDRIVIGSLDKQFALLHSGYCALVQALPVADLYRKPLRADAHQLASVGETVLRAAAVVEQAFGGITANLWDDPFEWTLPENLATPARIVEYLEEVEATRQLAFRSFVRDRDLLKEIMGPAGATQTLIDLLAGTLARAAEYYGRAVATRSLLFAAVTGAWHAVEKVS